MRIFGLLYTDASTETYFNFPLRCAETAEDYLVDLLLRTQLDGPSSGPSCGAFMDFLSDVVLRHVFNPSVRNVSISGYDAETASVVLVDAGFEAGQEIHFEPLPPPDRYGRVYEQQRSERYVVPVSKILDQMELACEDRVTWDLLQNEYLGPCSRLPPASVSAGSTVSLASVENAVEVDAKAAGLDLSEDAQAPPKKQRHD